LSFHKITTPPSWSLSCISPLPFLLNLLFSYSTLLVLLLSLYPPGRLTAFLLSVSYSYVSG
jgi:hypothetical protein